MEIFIFSLSEEDTSLIMLYRMDFFKETLDSLRVERYGRQSSKKLFRVVDSNIHPSSIPEKVIWDVYIVYFAGLMAEKDFNVQYIVPCFFIQYTR